MPGDAEAIRRCLSGHVESFRQIVERYQVRAFAHALTLAGNREDARDAVQEAFLDAFRHLRDFDVRREFYPWLYVLLRNRCLKSHRANLRQKGAVQGLAQQVRLVRADSDRDADSQWINEILLSLSPDDREILLLRHFDGLTYAELAERLEIPQGTVMSRLFHARRRFKLAVEECPSRGERRDHD